MKRKPSRAWAPFVRIKLPRMVARDLKRRDTGLWLDFFVGGFDVFDKGRAFFTDEKTALILLGDCTAVTSRWGPKMPVRLRRAYLALAEQITREIGESQMHFDLMELLDTDEPKAEAAA